MQTQNLQKRALFWSTEVVVENTEFEIEAETGFDMVALDIVWVEPCIEWVDFDTVGTEFDIEKLELDTEATVGSHIVVEFDIEQTADTESELGKAEVDTEAGAGKVEAELVVGLVEFVVFAEFFVD